jgi:GNAT superfamily N-acetyltransferase
MSTANHRIERLTPPASDADIRSLAELLMDAVDSGAAVSFLATLTVERAEEWWRRAVVSPTCAVILVARDPAQGGRIVGTVQLQAAWAPNQPHRAEVAKLLVHRGSRGAGLGTSLMRAVEEAAAAAGFRLITLDAKGGGAADRLYRTLGWTLVGVIPGFALDTDGVTPHDGVIFYKEVSAPAPGMR